MNDFLKDLSDLMDKHGVQEICGCYGHGTWIEGKDDEYFSTDEMGKKGILDGDYPYCGFESKAIREYLEKEGKKMSDKEKELRKALEAITEIYNNPKTGNLVALSAIGSIAKRALESK